MLKKYFICRAIHNKKSRKSNKIAKKENRHKLHPENK